MFGVRLHPDTTGCMHELSVVMGVYQCSRCFRVFQTIETDAGPRLKAEEAQQPPEGKRCRG